MSSTIENDIGNFYDASSQLWEKIWGEHMHHGYYGRAGNQKIDRRLAQINLIEKLLKWANINTAKNILDVGCGIGGSTLYLAEKFQANGVGITLSQMQASRGKERAIEAGLESRVEFQVANALNMPFADNTFDFVWSLESGEHMADKVKFLEECYRVLQPGGTFVMATWCHRSTNSLAGELTSQEKKLLEDIYRVYCLPFVISLQEYEAIAGLDCGFQDIKTDDWSMAVAPFWDVVIDSALDLNAIQGLIDSGWKTVEAALSLGLMTKGYQTGLIRFGLLTGKKL